ncbi:MAG: TIGR03986 family CRISPR-associated RAMP protein [Deltaproteobacteria bacterium]|nr:MAG: TIGR03986 family CRISPR-associated RAMP protein [Deltaproteobacteria bacterium]
MEIGLLIKKHDGQFLVQTSQGDFLEIDHTGALPESHTYVWYNLANGRAAEIKKAFFGKYNSPRNTIRAKGKTIRNVNQPNFQNNQEVVFSLQPNRQLRNNMTAADLENLRRTQTADFGSFDFITPYNFVRLGRPGPRIGPEIGHDRFAAGRYNGRLRCAIEVKTPLCLPDAEQMTEENLSDGKKHQKYPFLRFSDQLLIPGTAIKGMLRSVYESLTGSCLSIFHDQREVINYRAKPTGQAIKAGIVLQLPKDDQNPGRILACREHNYANGDNVRGENVLVDTYFNGTTWEYDRNNHCNLNVANIDPTDQINGQLFFASYAGPYNYRKGNNHFTFLHVEQLYPSCTQAGLSPGFLKITGKKERSNKHSERFFLPPQQKLIEIINRYIRERKAYPKTCKKFTSIHGKELWDSAHPTKKFTFSSKEQNRYESIQRRQLKEGKARLASDGGAANKTTYDHEGLKVGDLIYFRDGGGQQAEKISYVILAKESFDTTPHELLSNQDPGFPPCTKLDKLCPACRLFGGVDLAEETGEEVSKPAALAGRVSPGNALPAEGSNPQTEAEVTLKILGSPKETATSFYLVDAGGENTEGIPKKVDDGYDHEPQPHLRGRKFYWHQADGSEDHPLPEAAYRTAEKSNQNATVELVTGGTFVFDLDFENLSGEEFAALIWCLELEEGLCHKLGHGRSLGLGTVKIAIDREKSFLVDIEQRYRELASGIVHFADCGFEAAVAENPETSETIREYRITFAEQHRETFPSCSFDLKLAGGESYEDLCRILKFHPAMHGRFSYPQAREGGKVTGYAWFKKYPRQPLKTIAQTVAGGHQTGNAVKPASQITC